MGYLTATLENFQRYFLSHSDLVNAILQCPTYTTKLMDYALSTLENRKRFFASFLDISKIIPICPTYTPQLIQCSFDTNILIRVVNGLNNKFREAGIKNIKNTELFLAKLIESALSSPENGKKLFDLMNISDFITVAELCPQFSTQLIEYMLLPENRQKYFLKDFSKDQHDYYISSMIEQWPSYETQIKNILHANILSNNPSLGLSSTLSLFSNQKQIDLPSNKTIVEKTPSFESKNQNNKK